jgi:hypothetical protein
MTEDIKEQQVINWSIAAVSGEAYKLRVKS